MIISEEALIYESVTFILQCKELTKITKLKNGCYAVGYEGKGTIVSGKKISEILSGNHEYLYQKARIRKLVKNSKTVEFAKFYSQSAFTVKGYRVTLDSCSCPFKKAGNSICKHQIAYARTLGYGSLSEFINMRKAG